MRRVNRWLEVLGATSIVVLSSALVLAQGGGPPPTPKCYNCRPSPGYCGYETISAEICCCCWNSWQEYWDCKEFNAEFDCVYPDYPWESCFRVL